MANPTGDPFLSAIKVTAPLRFDMDRVWEPAVGEYSANASSPRLEMKVSSLGCFRRIVQAALRMLGTD
jgi:hypothetical protein